MSDCLQISSACKRGCTNGVIVNGLELEIKSKVPIPVGFIIVTYALGKDINPSFFLPCMG